MLDQQCKHFNTLINNIRPRIELLKNKLPLYNIPADVAQKYQDHFYDENDLEFILSKKTHEKVFSTLLYIEEMQQNIDIKKYDMTGVTLLLVGNNSATQIFELKGKH